MVADGSYPGDYAANLVPLSDGAGDVVAVGEGVTKFAVGDRVINSKIVRRLEKKGHRS